MSKWSHRARIGCKEHYEFESPLQTSLSQSEYRWFKQLAMNSSICISCEIWSMVWSELSDSTCIGSRRYGLRDWLPLFCWFRMGLRQVGAWWAARHWWEGPEDRVGIGLRQCLGCQHEGHGDWIAWCCWGALFCRVGIGLRWCLGYQCKGHRDWNIWCCWGVIRAVASSNAQTFLAHKKIPYQCIMWDGARIHENRYLPII